ncbi:hypothetical protein PCASD_14426 [Puccinia coronata f. sp. avenae]|uniref:Uncharacterized protein n=1 Tax=Puccinia coronata f. sp. avenae TaxID=200324 RepID=A0A2N5UDN7_9BASI|nr:hypothetical protein PCASD_14426 [Puccinia coronata f. sp. avenae]
MDSDTVLLPHGCVFAGDSCPIQLYFLALQTQTQILLAQISTASRYLSPPLHRLHFSRPHA